MADELLVRVVQLEFDIQENILQLKESVLSTAEAATVSSDVRNQLKRLKRLIEEASVLADAADTEGEAEEMLTKLKQHEIECTNLTMELRKANLSHRDNAARKFRQEKEELMSGGTQQDKRKTMEKNKALVATSQEITHGLRRTKQLIANELERARATMTVIEDSSTKLKDVSKEYTTFGATVRSAKGLITKLKRREITDKVLLWAGVLLFMTVVLFVLKRRLAYMFLSEQTADPSMVDGDAAVPVNEMVMNDDVIEMDELEL